MSTRSILLEECDISHSVNESVRTDFYKSMVHHTLNNESVQTDF
jgi:hypothetical protein